MLTTNQNAGFVTVPSENKIIYVIQPSAKFVQLYAVNNIHSSSWKLLYCEMQVFYQLDTVLSSLFFIN